MASLTRFHERGGAVSDIARKIARNKMTRDVQAFRPLAVSFDSTVRTAS